MSQTEMIFKAMEPLLASDSDFVKGLGRTHLTSVETSTDKDLFFVGSDRGTISSFAIQRTKEEKTEVLSAFLMETVQLTFEGQPDNTLVLHIMSHDVQGLLFVHTPFRTYVMRQTPLTQVAVCTYGVKKLKQLLKLSDQMAMEAVGLRNPLRSQTQTQFCCLMTDGSLAFFQIGNPDHLSDSEVKPYHIDQGLVPLLKRGHGGSGSCAVFWMGDKLIVGCDGAYYAAHYDPQGTTTANTNPLSLSLHTGLNASSSFEWRPINQRAPGGPPFPSLIAFNPVQECVAVSLPEMIALNLSYSGDVVQGQYFLRGSFPTLFSVSSPFQILSSSSSTIAVFDMITCGEEKQVIRVPLGKEVRSLSSSDASMVLAVLSDNSVMSIVRNHPSHYLYHMIRHLHKPLEARALLEFLSTRADFQYKHHSIRFQQMICIGFFVHGLFSEAQEIFSSSSYSLDLRPLICSFSPPSPPPSSPSPASFSSSASVPLVGSGGMMEEVCLVPKSLRAEIKPNFLFEISRSIPLSEYLSHCVQILLSARPSNISIPIQIKWIDSALMLYFMRTVPGVREMRKFVVEKAYFEAEDFETIEAGGAQGSEDQKIHKDLIRGIVLVQTGKPSEALDLWASDHMASYLRMANVSSGLSLASKKAGGEDEEKRKFDAVDAVIALLQKLQDFHLLEKHIKWVFTNATPQKAIKLFTSKKGMYGIDPLRLKEVFQRMVPPQPHPNFLILLLERLVFTLHSPLEAFHTLLGREYIAAIQASSRSGASRRRGHFHVDLSVFTNFNLLLEGMKYNAELLLSDIKEESLLADQRVCLLGQLGRHEEALKVLVKKDDVLIEKSFKQAEEYCAKYINSSKDIYYHLISSYLQEVTPNSVDDPFLKRALEFLGKYADQLDFVKVVESLPASLPLNLVSLHLVNVLKISTAKHRSLAIQQSVCSLANQKMKRQKDEGRVAHVTLTERSVCSVCGQSIKANAPFNLMPNKAIVCASKTCVKSAESALFSRHCV